MNSSSPPSFERLTSAKLKPMTSRRKIKKMTRKYLRATSSLLEEDRPKTSSELEKSGYVLSEALIELESEKMRNLTPKQAAICAALAVAEAEEAVREAEVAEAEAEAAEAFAEAVESRLQGKPERRTVTLHKGTLPSMPLNILLPFPKNRAPNLVCLKAEVEASIAEAEELAKEAEADAEAAQAFSQAALKMWQAIN